MRPLPRPLTRACSRPVAVGVAALVAVPLLTSPAVGCGGPAEVAHVRTTAALEDDGTPDRIRDERSATSADGAGCASGRDVEVEALPIAVAILHRDATAGTVELDRLAEADGPITTRIAVRDTTAQDRALAVATPGEDTREVTRRVGVPHLVRVTVRYPDGWSRIVPADPGVRVDARPGGGVEVSDTRVLFPPVTDDELVVGIESQPGRGAPEIAVEATPIGPSTASLLDADPLGRDAAAVVGALTELAVDGARQLADGTGELAGGIAELADGTDELAAGLGEAAAGVGPLGDGIDELASGSRQLAGGLDELAGGLPELGEGAAALGAGNRELADGLREAAEGADELAEGNEEAAEGNEQAAEGNQQLADATAGFIVASEALGEAAAGLRAGLDALDGLPGGVLDPLTGPLTELVGQLEELAGAAAAISAGNAELAEGNRQLAEGNRQLAEGNRELAAGLREAAAGADELGAGNRELAAGAGEAAGGARELADGTAELADGAGQLSQGFGQAADGIGEAAAGASALADGGREAADGAGELADGAGELPDALDQARDTADRDLERDAERTAVVEAGRERAEEVVADRIDAPQGTWSTTLTAAGDDPVSGWVWAALAAVLAVAAAIAAVLRRRALGATATAEVAS